MWRSQVEHTRLVVTVTAGHQAIPIVRTQERPGGDGTQIHALSSQFLCRVPNLLQPAQLLLAGATEVYLRHRERQSVANRHLAHQHMWFRQLGTDTHRFYVCILVPPISPMQA